MFWACEISHYLQIWGHRGLAFSQATAQGALLCLFHANLNPNQYLSLPHGIFLRIDIGTLSTNTHTESLSISPKGCILLKLVCNSLSIKFFFSASPPSLTMSFFRSLQNYLTTLIKLEMCVKSLIQAHPSASLRWRLKSETIPPLLIAIWRLALSL